MNLKSMFLALGLCLSLSYVSAATLPRAEHPTPQFERIQWQNLNGQWDYTFDYAGTGLERNLQQATSYADKITVPFCPESKLSGVQHKDFIEHIWYHRTIQAPADWQGKDVLLHFGAVYYTSEVYIDGALVGRHFGGSSAFTYNVTEFLKDGKEHHLVVRAQSNVRGMEQGTGKQSLRYGSYDCNYTRTTGIWQTVWMEAVDAAGLQTVQVIPDIDQKQLVIRPQFYTEEGNQFTVILSDGGKVVAKATAKASNWSTVVIPLKNIKLWSPESPFLYDIEYQVTNAQGALIDQVKSYVGMRKVHTQGNKVYLNNQPYYLRLVLDQGFYPDGIWTAPSDEALRHDIEMSMAVGFNGARLHQKVFDDRFYYWADKMGYLTWSEAPSWGMDANTVAAARNFITEWRELVEQYRNHPSIIAWTPMNEEFWPDGYQFPRLSEDLYNETKAIDPTRPVNTSSGGSHIKTDLWTAHNYEQDPAKLKEILYNDGKLFQTPVYKAKPAEYNVGYNRLAETDVYRYPIYDFKVPYILDEVGGIKWVKDQDKSNKQTESWGYGAPPQTEQEFFSRLEGQINAVLELSKYIWGYCYTQLTDVEQEQNGVYFYDRTPKFDAARWRAIFGKNPQ